MKRILFRFRNLGYAIGIFFYIDLIAACTIGCAPDIVEHYEIKRDAALILETPNLNKN